MILITAQVIEDNLPKKLVDYEQVYMFMAGLKDVPYCQIVDGSIYILLDNSQNYFKLCFDLILALNNEGLISRLYISQSNEQIDVATIEPLNNDYQVFKLNANLRKDCIGSKMHRKNKHFSIRAHHPTLDSILYSLSVLCFKYERNLQLLYDKYYLGLTQTEIATKHHISQVAVSKKLKSSNYEMFKMIVGRL